ncbi:hypothetical protein WAI453_007650 [Rhynchosporium graminicola]
MIARGPRFNPGSRPDSVSAYTVPIIYALVARSTTLSNPYVPKEDYCKFCSTSPCSCGWAEDCEHPIYPTLSGPYPACTPLLFLVRAGPVAELLGLAPELEDREQPKPPPPRPLPPMLPPLP